MPIHSKTDGLKKWTAPQQAAIDSALQSTAVLAGAGSGKTDILVERILALLTRHSVALHEIVAITFTEKSGAELKHRLAARLPEALLQELALAPIGTFHSFFAKIVQEFGPV